MKIYFSHGMESNSRGTKIRTLADIAGQHGMETHSIDYTDTLDPDRRVERLLDTIRNETDDIILVGSSMGGYVSLVVSQSANVSGLFLLAPALEMPNYKCQHYSSLCQNIEIVHGWSDEVIPIENSLRYARQAKSTLHLIDGDHRLNSSLGVVSLLFESFIASTRSAVAMQ
jgi:esterase/lipase